MDGIAARMKKTIRKAPPGFSQSKSFPRHITHFLSSYFKDFSLFEIVKGGPFTSWSEKCGVRFHTIDSPTLLAVDSAAKGVLIRKIEDYAPGWWLRSTAMKLFGRGTIICYYYGLLVYIALCRRQHKTKTYGKRIWL